jgi:hypothetical protein
MWPIQLVFLLGVICRILPSGDALCYFFISHTIGPTDLHPSPSSHFKMLWKLHNNLYRYAYHLLFSTSGPRISPQYRARPFAVKRSL